MRVYIAASLDLLSEWFQRRVVPAGGQRFVAEQEDEESEYAALMAAATASRDQGAARRVVVVAEADGDAAVPLDRVVAVHADPVEDVPVEDDLAWYAAGEIRDLV